MGWTGADRPEGLGDAFGLRVDSMAAQQMIVDRFEGEAGEIAVCELDDGTFANVPVADLPAGVREGTVLRRVVPDAVGSVVPGAVSDSAAAESATSGGVSGNDVVGAVAVEDAASEGAAVSAGAAGAWVNATDATAMSENATDATAMSESATDKNVVGENAADTWVIDTDEEAARRARIQRKMDSLFV